MTALPEPPRPAATLRTVLRGIPTTIASGLRMGRSDTLVRRVLLSAAAAGSALAAIELLTPGRAATLTGASESGAVLFAALACAGFICSGVGSHLSPRTARLAGSGERAVMVSLGTSAIGLLLLGATAASTGVSSTFLAATGYGLVYLGLGAAGPSENDILHSRIAKAGQGNRPVCPVPCHATGGSSHRSDRGRPSARPTALAAGRHRDAGRSSPVDSPQRAHTPHYRDNTTATHRVTHPDNISSDPHHPAADQ